MNDLESRPQFQDLTPLLRPRSVAVIGASERAGNLGGVAVRLMAKFGYPGEIWPVNPKGSRVHGHASFTSVRDLPAPADLAVIGTGVEVAAEMVRQCAAAGIRYGIVWAGGYSETGEDGAALQESLLRICQQTGFTLVGPNCIGVINSKPPMVASFASFLVEADRLIPGNIAMISQSGGLATMAQAMAQRKGIGFSLTVSSGNEAMLTAADFIHALAADDDTKVIAAYLEGVRDGERFVEAVSVAQAAGKPVVVLKGGMTAASARAAAAHTGALAGERRVWEAMALELGMISVASLEELLDLALWLSCMDLGRQPKGKGVAAVTFGGGSGVLSADQCDMHGLETPPLGLETLAKLKPLVPPIASIGNPIDLTPQTFNHDKWFAALPEALDTIAADPAIDTVLCQFGPMAQRGPETARIVADLRHRTAKTVCLAWPLAPSGVYDVLEREGVYVFQEYERAISAIAKLANSAAHSIPDHRLRPPAFDWNAFVAEPRAGTVIGENECHSILSQAGLTTARGILTRNAAEALDAAQNLGFPLVAKGICARVTHRAAAGLVALDIRSEAELSAAYTRLDATAAKSGTPLEGIYVQEMIGQGLEIIVSSFRDPIFGTMISCGSGGNLAEVIDDVALSRAPLNEASARRLLKRLRIVKAAKKLTGKVDIGDLARFVARFSNLASSAPWERFVIEINPVKWSPQGVTAIDGLLIIEKP